MTKQRIEEIARMHELGLRKQDIAKVIGMSYEAFKELEGKTPELEEALKGARVKAKKEILENNKILTENIVPGLKKTFLNQEISALLNEIRFRLDAIERLNKTFDSPRQYQMIHCHFNQ